MYIDKPMQGHGLMQAIARVNRVFRDKPGGLVVEKMIARELVETVKRNTSIDWTLKEGVKANLRRLVRRILNKYGYPPDKQAKAVQTVLEQAEVLARDWVGGAADVRNA